MDNKEDKEIEEELKKLEHRFKILYNRFLAVAMDYKDKIDSKFGNDEIFKLRNNLMYGLDSARFHFDLLLDYHKFIEKSYKDLYKISPTEVIHGSIGTMSMQDQYTKQIYSLFDSMIYHVCSIFDYLFRLVNFIHGKEIAKNPKWNLFQIKRNQKDFMFCSSEMIDKFEEIDKKFVYSLIMHRSHLIHTAKVMGEFQLSFTMDGGSFSANFNSTKLFRKHFPEIEVEHGDKDFNIKQASLWLLDKTIKYTTEILFELRDEIDKKKIRSRGMIISLGPGNKVQSISTDYWGEREVC